MKNRELTEKKIIDAVERIIENQGFEKLGINAVASEAGVSKMLIYRYFGGLDELLAHYLMQKDYWANTDTTILEQANVGESIKNMFRKQIKQMRNDIMLKRLCRWELTADNDNIRTLQDRRERNGRDLIQMVARLTGCSNAEVASLATILSASISYLVLMEEQTSTYNGIDLQSEEGWKQIMDGIGLMIDLWLKSIDK
ncbi:TetR/AcrR family transcriptional regulator [Prevotella intermedia]|jgi:transcriptional regulator, tetR family|nr:TetR/AcrR family transcriptional regulator [Prevotella intermedia]ATV29993.1 TetR/AcrR family transcriptional regulator [Prevotella intermedia]ATV33404.1 TetR/AcrR family transcriptional regulator [Prevotella intermedia]ATV38805.1 TetR/AcrR family transcriptional regulator [Prevotella intermedia]ATV40191.1 TetR/AcrR family transcriptional regulator [Prevotella intermedia]OWP34107.1 TetR family transcriptional regulator [Prevotella intermedia]